MSLRKYATLNAASQEDKLKGSFLKLREENKLLVEKMARLQHQLQDAYRKKIFAERMYFQLYRHIYYEL